MFERINVWLLICLVVCVQARAETARLSIMAASSLSESLTNLVDIWKKQTGKSVSLQFGSSSQLAQQIIYGAPADIFFSADPEWIQRLVDKNLVEPSSVIELLSNRLALVIQSKRLLPNSSLSGLTDAKIKKIALGTPTSPIGAYALNVLKAKSLMPEIESKIIYAPSAKMVLRLVADGDVDAGIVYSSDSYREDRVKTIEILDSSQHRKIIYSAASLKLRDSATVRSFLIFCKSATANSIFKEHGFIVLAGIK